MSTVLIDQHATLSEIDEALTYARQLPQDKRGPGWYAFTDRLLELRAAKNTGAPLAPAFNSGHN
jgi:predicted secreted protein